MSVDTLNVDTQWYIFRQWSRDNLASVTPTAAATAWRRSTPSPSAWCCHTSRQTPSAGLRHPSFGGRCRKVAMLGVWQPGWWRLQAHRCRPGHWQLRHEAESLQLWLTETVTWWSVWFLSLDVKRHVSFTCVKLLLVRISVASLSQCLAPVCCYILWTNVWCLCAVLWTSVWYLCAVWAVCLVSVWCVVNQCLAPVWSVVNQCLVPVCCAVNQCLAPAWWEVNQCLVPVWCVVNQRLGLCAVLWTCRENDGSLCLTLCVSQSNKCGASSQDLCCKRRLQRKLGCFRKLLIACFFFFFFLDSLPKSRQLCI